MLAVYAAVLLCKSNILKCGSFKRPDRAAFSCRNIEVRYRSLCAMRHSSSNWSLEYWKRKDQHPFKATWKIPFSRYQQNKNMNFESSDRRYDALAETKISLMYYENLLLQGIKLTDLLENLLEMGSGQSWAAEQRENGEYLVDYICAWHLRYDKRCR